MALNIFRAVTLFTAVTFSALGLFVLSRNFSSKLNRTFCAFLLAVGLWSLGFFLTMFQSLPYEFTLLSSRLSHLSGGVSPIIYLYFVIQFLKLNRKVHPLNWSLTAFISVMCLTPLVVKELRLKLFFPYYPEAGILYPLFIVNYLGNFGKAFLILNGEYKRADSELRRMQIIYALVAVLIGWLSVGTLFLLIYNIQMTPALIFLPLLVILFAYSIIRHQFLDIEVIIKRTVVFAGLSLGVLGAVALMTFVTQDVLARYIAIPKILSNFIAAGLIAAFYNPLRVWLINITDRFLFQKKYDYKELLKQFMDEVLVGIRDLKQLSQMTVNRLTDTVKLDSCSLLLLNKDTRTYELSAVKGADGRQVALEEQEPFITFLRETREPIGKDGQLGKVRFPEAVIARLNQLNACLCLPLHLHEDLVGVLCLGKKKSDEEFTQDDLDTFRQVAGTLAIAVANAQQAEEVARTQAVAAQNEKLAVIGTLSAGINHEICNPLGIVKAQCEAFLLDQEDGILIGKTSQEVLDRTATIMRVALKQIDRATAITQKLSNFAKPIKEMKAESVSVAQEVDEVILLVGHDLKLEKIEVKKEIESDLPSIIADRRQLQEVLFNLVRNAGQAIKPPGTIWVRAHAGAEGQVRIEIADTGSGIPADKLEKIYDPFYTTKEPGKGTGLGLFIVRQIVERNKGRISVESVVGKGTTFFLDFPAARGARADMAIQNA